MDAKVLYSAADKSTARFFAPRITFLYWIRLAHRASTIPVGNAQGQKFGHSDHSFLAYAGTSIVTRFRGDVKNNYSYL